MVAEKSDPSKTLDELQGKLRSALAERGFRTRGRAFNRTTSDGLTEVVHIQMGSFDPPGTTYIPGLCENLYGKFTVNLGVFVPEVAEQQGHRPLNSFVREIHCCVRTRLGRLGSEPRDIWWDIRRDDALTEELRQRLISDAIRKFETRDAILAELLTATRSPSITPPRIVCAIILAARGRTNDARSLLAEQAKETRNPGHPAYVRSLAERLGLAPLDGN